MAATSEIAKQLDDITTRLGTSTAARYEVADLIKTHGAAAVDNAVKHNDTRHLYR